MTNDETIHKLMKLKMPAFVTGFRELIESVPDKRNHLGRAGSGCSSTASGPIERTVA